MTMIGGAFTTFADIRQVNPGSHPLNIGWVYTRLVFKGAYVLSRSHDYEREWEVLSELLDQKLYRRGRRGEWWERRALIEERYMWQNDNSMSKPQVKKKWLKKSLETCELALQD